MQHEPAVRVLPCGYALPAVHCGMFVDGGRGLFDMQFDSTTAYVEGIVYPLRGKVGVLPPGLKIAFHGLHG